MRDANTQWTTDRTTKMARTTAGNALSFHTSPITHRGRLHKRAKVRRCPDTINITVPIAEGSRRWSIRYQSQKVESQYAGFVRSASVVGTSGTKKTKGLHQGPHKRRKLKWKNGIDVLVAPSCPKGKMVGRSKNAPCVEYPCRKTISRRELLFVDRVIECKRKENLT